MQSKTLAGPKPGVPSQRFLDIAEIKQGTVVLKDGSLRALIAVSSTNFSLKSADEQNAQIASYQSFLNALEFSIQILMQSRKLDINSYLDKLRAVMQQQTNELLRMQTQEYIEYISKLIEFASIMNKTFYVVVPLSSAGTKIGLLQKISNAFSPGRQISGKSQEFETGREELLKRVNQVMSGLGSMGLKTILLGTEELVELMYNSYNLDTASSIKIKSVEELGLSASETR